MQFTYHLKDGLHVIPLKKGNTRNKRINGRGLVLGPQKCTCYLLIYLESKCLKQQYILAYISSCNFYFAKSLEREGPHSVAAQNVIHE